MVRIESWEEGADGVARAKTPGGSLFRLRSAYWDGALAELELSAPAGDSLAAGIELPAEALELAAEAFEAECRAAALLARAEQTRRGLEIKLAKRELSAPAAAMALDWLAGRGLQSDLRFAQAWIRQRARHRAEGPRTLLAGLASRGVEREAVRLALAEALSGEARLVMAGTALELLEKKERDEGRVRDAFLSLGWKPSDLREALDSRRIDG